MNFQTIVIYENTTQITKDNKTNDDGRHHRWHYRTGGTTEHHRTHISTQRLPNRLHTSHSHPPFTVYPPFHKWFHFSKIIRNPS